ncbi:MAG: D-glycero-alpha-D-manno-heptose-1,7-bisphosphate 7-phosphatase [Solirubrobacterales bacterium]
MNAAHEIVRPQAVFFDRDGTLIEHVPYLSDPEQVVLLPGVREALTRLRAAAIRMFLVTNQSGVGRGLFTMAEVEAVNQRLVELLDLGPEPFTGICIAPELPGEPSRYRKPSPRYIHEMLAVHGIPATAAWMVGDSPVDWEAGLAAGVRTAAIPAAREATATAGVRADGVVEFPGMLAWVETLGVS